MRAEEFIVNEDWKDVAKKGALAAAIAAGGYTGNKLATHDAEAYQAPVPNFYYNGQQQMKQPTPPPPPQQVAPQTKQKTIPHSQIPTLTGTDAERFLREDGLQAGMGKSELAAFLGQMAHESAGFTDMVENNPNIERLSTGKTAKMLGNKSVNDAKRFIGRGYIQLTGRWNYSWMQKELGIDLTSTWSAAHQAADPKIAADIALAYWKKRVRPRVANWGNVKQVTAPINSNLRGLVDRREKTDAFYDYLTQLEEKGFVDFSKNP